MSGRRLAAVLSQRSVDVLVVRYVGDVSEALGAAARAGAGAEALCAEGRIGDGVEALVEALPRIQEALVLARVLIGAAVTSRRA